MKKFVSMAMVAAMTTSMVPATAFAAGEVTTTAKIVDALELTKDEAKTNPDITNTNYANKVPELQLTVTGVDYRNTQAAASVKEVTLTLDNATFDADKSGTVTVGEVSGLVKVIDEDGNDAAASTTTTTNDSYDNAVKADAEGIYSTAGGYVEIANVPAKTVVTTPAVEGADAVTDRASEGTFNVTVAGTDAITYAIDGAAAVTLSNDGTTVAGTAATHAQALAEAIAEGKSIVWTGTNNTNGELVTITYTVTGAGSPMVSETADALAADAFDYAAVETTYAAGADAADYLVTNGDAIYVKNYTAGGTTTTPARVSVTNVTVNDEDEVTFEFTGEFKKDDIIIFDLDSLLDKTGINSTATVSVSGDLVEVDDLVYVSVLGRGITAETKKIANVAEEEKTYLERDLKIKSTVGNFVNNQVLELKLSNGFEFANIDTVATATYQLSTTNDDDVIQLKVIGTPDEIVIDKGDIEIEAVDAKSGSEATIKVKSTTDFNASASVVVAKVVDYTVIMSVDEDEDVPVIYSGVNVNNYGITDDSDHLSLEVTIEESFPGAWSMRKGFDLELPDGVYVTDMDVLEAKNFVYGVGAGTTAADEQNWREAFWNAYKEGEHKGFEFDKRVFNDVDTSLANDPAEVTFQLELVADPGFVGDVNLKFTGDLVDEQEVTIAKFATPFMVQAEQNDLKIDYRYTEVPTDIVITETEAGLWDADKAVFGLYIEEDLLSFEEDPTFEVTGDMELEDAELVSKYDLDGDGFTNTAIMFTVDSESDEAATVTISDMSLFMNRNIPAGAYDLELATSMGALYKQEILFAPDNLAKANVADATPDIPVYDTDLTAGGSPLVPAWSATPDMTAVHPNERTPGTVKADTYIDDITDMSTTVKEAFVNIVTAGREQDDASFTTKVVVPVGESYIVSGENTVELDVPAYISAAGYTMLPVRAVATALGINNNNVIWNGESKTVTILYGQRIITMVAGQKVINVNGSAIPASAAVEITDGRTFLPMRDLATALGVTDITWDAATKTATLNGGVVAE